MNKKIIIIILSSISLVLVIVFYINLAKGFGDAIINSAVGIKNARTEWKNENVNPVDSIKNGVKKLSEIE